MNNFENIFVVVFVCIPALLIFVGVLSALNYKPSTPAPKTKTYPRILGESGVYVEEYGDFEMATVETAPLTVAVMDMQEAKKIAEDVR